MVLARAGFAVGESSLSSGPACAARYRLFADAFVAIEDHGFYQHDGVDMSYRRRDQDAVRGNPAAPARLRSISLVTCTLRSRPSDMSRCAAAEQGARPEMERRTRDEILEA